MTLLALIGFLFGAIYLLSLGLPPGNYLGSPESILAAALGVTFVLAGTLHFMKRGMPTYLKMMPPFIQRPVFWIYFTGVLEILGGVGLLLPPLRPLAAGGLILLLLAILPANVHAARKGFYYVPWERIIPYSLWLRIPIQLVYIGLLVRAASRS